VRPITPFNQQFTEETFAASDDWAAVDRMQMRQPGFELVVCHTAKRLRIELTNNGEEK